MSGIWIAILSGVLMSVQGVWNTQLTRQAGLWLSTAWVHLSALAVCAAAWFFSGRSGIRLLGQANPHYILLGGVIGAFITVTVVGATSSLGPAKAAMLIVTAQLAASSLIELFGLFGMERQPFLWRKALGLGAAVCGFLLFQWEKA